MTPWLAHARRRPGRILFGAVALIVWWAVLAMGLMVISGVIAP